MYFLYTRNTRKESSEWEIQREDQQPMPVQDVPAGRGGEAPSSEKEIDVDKTQPGEGQRAIWL